MLVYSTGLVKLKSAFSFLYKNLFVRKNTIQEIGIPKKDPKTAKDAYLIAINPLAEPTIKVKT